MYNNNKGKLENLKGEYKNINGRLEEFLKDGLISEFTKRTIIEMSERVLENIARKYENIIKGVKEAMGGQILEYEAKTIRNERTNEIAKNMIRAGRLTYAEIAEYSGLTLKEIERLASGEMKK